VGDLGAYEIAEVVLLAAKSLALLGENWVLDISHMGLLAAVLEDSGLSPEDQQQAMEYLHRKNYHQLNDKAVPAPCMQDKSLMRYAPHRH
jgi:ATP phosphoribosyltransferase regulatory subunit